MRAITVNEYGAAPALTEMPDPRPGSGQLLIRTEAAGMNPMDRTIANGGWKAQMPASFPLILGADLAGVIEAVGEGAGRFLPGDEVFGQLLIVPLGTAGTYAEYVAVTEDAPLARLPKGLEPSIAAALPTAGVTALEIVESVEPLTSKTVLMVGAAGGVGSFATQLAANAGAQVIAVAPAGPTTVCVTTAQPRRSTARRPRCWTPCSGRTRTASMSSSTWRATPTTSPPSRHSFVPAARR